MNTDWLDFLTKDNAQIDSNQVSHFGDPTAELQQAQISSVLIDLSHLGLIRISGEDAQSFCRDS